MVNRDHVEGVLADLDALAMSRPDPELRAIETALVLEDVFAVRVSDAQIDAAAHDDDPRALAALLGLASRSR